MAKKHSRKKLSKMDWCQSVWEDLWNDGCEGHCDEDGEFPEDDPYTLWVLLKNGAEFHGKLTHLWEEGGVSISRDEGFPREIEFNVKEVAAYQLFPR
jgi:hypothetical protein